MKKLALIGTSCAGKTTTCLAVAHALKMRSIKAEAITSTDRRHGFCHADLSTSEDAQAFIILQHASVEAFWGARRDAEIIVSDRSVLDFYAYYVASFGRSPRRNAIEDFVYGWLATYDALVYLPPLPFVDDGKRPPDDFRLRVDRVLMSMIAEKSQRFPIYGYDRRLTVDEVIDVAIGLHNSGQDS